jgi:hypothetical protein
MISPGTQKIGEHTETDKTGILSKGRDPDPSPGGGDQRRSEVDQDVQVTDPI